MLSFIAWLPAFFSAYVAFIRSPEKAFLNIYLPVLLLIPQIFYAQTEGFPKLNTSDTTIIPIFLAFVIYHGFGWHFSITDVLIIFYIFSGYFSEYTNTDLHYANNKLATALCDNFAPYVLAKGMLHSRGLTLPFAKRLVFLMFINVFISAYEMRFIAIPQVLLLDPFFPGQSSDWPPLFRYGLLRIRGPFMQTILFGIGLALALILNVWLNRNKLWTPNFKHLPPLPLSKGTILSVGLGLGLILTFSRGPLAVCLIAMILLGAGFSAKPLRSMLIRLSIACVLSLILLQSFITYTDIDPLLAKTDSEANIAYRGKIFREYLYYAWLTPTWGWGTEETPLLSGIKSIDNEYLLLFLQKGLVGLTLFISLILWMMARLFLRGIKTAARLRTDGSLAFTFLTLFFLFANSFLTVYMGLQVEILFFLITGWAEGFLLCKPAEVLDGRKDAKAQRTLSAFAPLRPSSKGAMHG